MTEDDDPPRAIKRTITIEIFDGNDFTIREAGASCDRLCWDEMVGTIAELTHPKIGQARYRMLTDEEHAAEERRHQECMQRNKELK